MSLEKEFVPFDLNQKLIDLGLKIEKPLMFRSFSGELSYSRFEYYTPAILWQQAFDWFRVQHGVHEQIVRGFNIITKKEYWSYGVDSSVGIFNTYESARYACLEKLIEIVSCKYEN